MLLSGATISINCVHRCMICDLKCQISWASGIPVEEQCLILLDEELKDFDKLSKYVRDGDELFVILLRIKKPYEELRGIWRMESGHIF